jgi:hypothetical protein
LITRAAPSPTSPSEADRYVQYVEGLERAFEEAVRRAGAIDKVYRIAGRLLRVRFAGETLVPLLSPALGHASVSAAEEPALTACVWDPQAIGVRLPEPPWGSEGQLPGGRVVRNWNGVELAFLPDGELNVFDRNRRLAFHSPGVARELSSIPLLTIIHWWMSEHNLYCVHAGAVGFESGGVLLVGRGGAGKSTATLSCLQSRLGYVADDFCLMSAESAPQAYSLYSSAKLEPDQIPKLPFLLRPDGRLKYSFGKAIVFLACDFPEKLLPGFPVRAVLVPKITGRTDTAATRVSPAEAIKALAPSTLFILSGSGQPGLAAMAKLVRSVPCYRLEVGTDLPTIPRAIEDILRISQ